MQYLEKHVINYYFTVAEENIRKLKRHRIGDFLDMNLYKVNSMDWKLGVYCSIILNGET